jgi:AraC-like DNA-binding protein
MGKHSRTLRPEWTPVYDVDCIRRPPGFNAIGRHHHDCYEILYYVSGRLTMFIRDRLFKVAEHDLALININDPHTNIYPDKTATERMAVRFNMAFLHGILDGPGPAIDVPAMFRITSPIIRLKGQARQAVEDTLNRMLAELGGSEPGAMLLSRLLLAQLLVQISRQARSRHPEVARKAGVSQALVSRVASYIRSNYADTHSLESIARHFGISRCYLARVFKRHTGFSVLEYVNNVRVTEAALLLKPTASVTRVAMRVGFESVSHFGRVFRRYFGVPPRVYRSRGPHRVRAGDMRF